MVVVLATLRLVAAVVRAGCSGALRLTLSRAQPIPTILPLALAAQVPPILRRVQTAGTVTLRCQRSLKSAALPSAVVQVVMIEA